MMQCCAMAACHGAVPTCQHKVKRERETERNRQRERERDSSSRCGGISSSSSSCESVNLFYSFLRCALIRAVKQVFFFLFYLFVFIVPRHVSSPFSSLPRFPPFTQIGYIFMVRFLHLTASSDISSKRRAQRLQL